MKSPIAELIVLDLGSKGCKLKTPQRHSVVSLTFYCKFGNFCEDFNFAKLRICEVS